MDLSDYEYGTFYCQSYGYWDKNTELNTPQLTASPDCIEMKAR